MFRHDKMYLPCCYTYSSILTRMSAKSDRSATQRGFFNGGSVKRLHAGGGTQEFFIPQIPGSVAGEESSRIVAIKREWPRN
jgi:hypothetical protein